MFENNLKFYFMLTNSKTKKRVLKTADYFKASPLKMHTVAASLKKQVSCKSFPSNQTKFTEQLSDYYTQLFFLS